MAMGEKPAYRLSIKDDSPDAKFKWKNIGAAWFRDDGKSFSCVLDLPDGTKMKFLMFENKPKSESNEAVKEQPKTVDQALGHDLIPF